MLELAAHERRVVLGRDRELLECSEMLHAVLPHRPDDATAPDGGDR